LDLENLEAIESYLREILDQFPYLCLLVNSASIYNQADIAETEIEMLEKQLKINFQAPFHLTRSFAKLLKRGEVINILDNKIHFNQPQYAAYTLSKKALAEFTSLAALEFAPRFRINGIAPGVILPKESRSSEYLEWRVSGIPLKQMGHPEHLTNAMSYLLDNDFVTGEILNIDGGESQTHVGYNAGMFQKDKI